MLAYSLVHTILGPTRGSIAPFIHAIELTAQRIFVERVAAEDLKLCDDVCVQVAKRLPNYQTGKSAARAMERWANQCWDKFLGSDLAVKYIGAPVDQRESPRKMVIYLATYSHFDRPYYQMIVEHPEAFTGEQPLAREQTVPSGGSPSAFGQC